MGLSKIRGLNINARALIMRPPTKDTNHRNSHLGLQWEMPLPMPPLPAAHVRREACQILGPPRFWVAVAEFDTSCDNRNEQEVKGFLHYGNST